MGDDDGLVPVVRPVDLVLRCTVRRDPQRPGRWLACCVDLDLFAVGEGPEGAARSLTQAVEGYLEAVLDPSKAGPVSHLLRRPAPLRERLYYRLLMLRGWLRGGGAAGGGRAFTDVLRLRLAQAG